MTKTTIRMKSATLLGLWLMATGALASERGPIPEAMDWFSAKGAKMMRGAERKMADGTVVYAPQMGDWYKATWLRDYVMMLEGGLVPTQNMAGAANVFLKGVSPEGEGLDCVKFDGQVVRQPGYGTCGENTVLDGYPYLVSLVYETWRQTGDRRWLAPSVLDTLKKALGRMPHRNGLPWIDPAKPYDRAPWGFTDSTKKTGNEFFCSLLEIRARRELAILLDAAGGRHGESVRENEAAEALVERVNRVFWDESKGLYLAATEKCRQGDVWGSAYAVWLGVADARRADAIAATFKKHYDGLVQNGQLRHLLPGEFWQAHNKFGPPGEYQNGYFWGTPVGWFCWTLERTDPALVDRTVRAILADYRKRGPNERTFGEKAYCADYLASVALPLQGLRRILQKRGGAIACATGCPEFTVEGPRERAGGVVRATDFGLSTKSEKNAAAINRALAEAKRTGAKRVELAPGTYRCLDEAGVVIEGFCDFTFDGKGAVLVFRRPPEYRCQLQSELLVEKGNVLVRKCERTLVTNFTMDWDWTHDPLAGYVKCVGKHPSANVDDAWFDVEFTDWTRHPFYPNPCPVQKMQAMRDDHLGFRAGHGFHFGQSEGHFGAKNEWIKPNVLRIWPGLLMPGKNQNPLHKFGQKASAEKIAIGETYRLQHCYYGKNGFNLVSNRHLTLRDITVWSCFGMAFVTDGTQKYWQFENVRVAPPRKAEFERAYPGETFFERPVSSVSDGHHVARSCGYAKYINCEWSRNNDDSSNFHDRFTIAIRVADNALQVVNRRGADYLRAEIGTTLELRNPDFSPTGAFLKLVRRQGDLLFTDGKIPAQKGVCFLVWDRSYGTDNVLMKGCRFVDTGFRNIFSPSNLTIEDCTFLRTSGSPVQFIADYRSDTWCEGMGATNLVVRNCRFEDNNVLNPAWAQISTLVVTPTGWQVPRPDKGFVGGGLLIEKCSFVRPRGPVLDLPTGRNVVFRDCTVDLRGVEEKWKDAGALRTDGAERVHVEHITYIGQKPVTVSVDPKNVKGVVPRTLYGTGMEDVNHEIYGGLDAQRLYDESFEEVLSPQKIPHCATGSGHKTCGRAWTAVLSGGGREETDGTVCHLGSRSQILEPNGGTAGVANRGLNGWGVPCRKNGRLVGHLFVRGTVDALEVALQSGDGLNTYASAPVAAAGGDDWRRIDFSLTSDTTDPKGRFLVKASGKGKVWIDDCYLKDEPTGEFGRLGCREDIVEGFRREGLTFLRWGGSMVNTPGYTLKNCQDDRRPYPGFWFKNSSTGFHVREFVRMAAAMKLPCAFSIYTHEDTAEAVKLAEWLKQFDIDIYVEIGNEEVTGWCDVVGEKRDVVTAKKYGVSVRRLVSAMRAVNPKLKFVSATMYFCDKVEVMEESFRQTDGYVDYWDIHVGAGAVDAGVSARRVLKHVRDLIARLNPKSTMKVAIFEENSYIHNVRRALAHASILEAAREQNGFLLTSCPANALQAWDQNDNGWDQGQVFYTTDKVWLQPCGWAQQMASAFHRDTLVAGQTDCADVSVSATADGKGLVLHLCNRSAQPKAVSLAVKGWEGKRPAKVVSLSAPCLEDHNPPEAMEAVVPVDVTEAFLRQPMLKPYSYTVVEIR